MTSTVSECNNFNWDRLISYFHYWSIHFIKEIKLWIITEITVFNITHGNGYTSPICYTYSLSHIRYIENRYNSSYLIIKILIFTISKNACGITPNSTFYIYTVNIIVTKIMS